MQRSDWAWARGLVAGAVPAGLAYSIGAAVAVPWWPLALLPLSAWITRPGADAAGKVAGGRRGYWWLAIALTAVSVLAAARARNLVDAAFGRDTWPSYDLASAPMPTSPPQYVAVTGVLRDGWTLAEYAVDAGDVPDQSRPAAAVLVPMTPTNDPTVRLQGAMVVVRVPTDTPRTTNRITLYGRTEPLDKALALTLVDLADGSADDLVGVLVDTLHLPQPREAWTAVGLVLGLVVGSSLGFAVGRRR